MQIFNVSYIKSPTKLPKIIHFVEAIKLLNTNTIADLSGFCIIVDDNNQALLANAARADFISAQPKLLASISNLAEFYLFDAKILAFVDNLGLLEQAALLKCDACALVDDNLRPDESLILRDE